MLTLSPHLPIPTPRRLVLLPFPAPFSANKHRPISTATCPQTRPFLPPPPPQDQFINDQDAADSAGEEDDDSDKPKSDKKAGRRKIKIEFIQDKSRRHITFSKRKAGIMKKAYELSTLTGTQVLLLVVSETGLVYTFTTAKLQPLVTQPEGKNLIQACLNAPHGTLPSSMPVGQPLGRATPTMGVPTHHSNVPGGLAIGGGGGKDDEGEVEEEGEHRGAKRRRRSSTTQSTGRHGRSASGGGGANAPPSPHSPPQAIPPSLSIPQHAHAQQGAQHAQQQQQQQQQQPPQIALGPSPTSTSPQQPTSPHYAHASPTQAYHPAPGQDMYGGQPGLMGTSAWSPPAPIRSLRRPVRVQPHIGRTVRARCKVGTGGDEGGVEGGRALWCCTRACLFFWLSMRRVIEFMMPLI
ncbi:hypothetical protein EW146_g8986 [Bondarzewia mesenterica]|uniref:MADS-box domain-containing protein n=1 Tax=Bondarzewia mesenterica TaxID=1095465 RepID=A0A4S4LA13_9AGAM|nr:hypothetical protein EW146_g8986 [Bondarzewia mesenterica]